MPGYQDVAFFRVLFSDTLESHRARIGRGLEFSPQIVTNVGGVMDIRSLQKPLKEQYRREPESSRITLTAMGTETSTPLSCSVDIGRAIYQAEAHKGVGGTGTAACSGDLLIGALAACAQLTCQLVATAMGIPTQHIEVSVSGEMDLQGTLGISKETPVGFEAIRVQFKLDAPQATPEQLRALQEKTEQYCVVLQTLLHPPRIETRWNSSDSDVM